MTADSVRSAALPLERAAWAPGRGAGVAMLLAAAVLWSLSGVAVKVANIDPVAFAFFRSLAAGVVMLPLIGFGRGAWPQARWMAASVLLYTTVVTLLILSMTRSTAATGILLQYTGPIFCAFFAWLFQGRTIGKRTAVAMGIAIVGMSVMIAGGWEREGWVGPTCGVLSGVAFGALILVLEQNERAVGGANPFAVVLINNGGAALILLPLCIYRGQLTQVTPWQLSLVGLTGVIQLALPYVLFQIALRRVRAVDASLLILLEPVLLPIWVAMATGEVPSIWTLIGGAAILIAMAVEAWKLEKEAVQQEAGA